MTCSECENGPTRLCVACYERELYGEQYHYKLRNAGEYGRWLKEWRWHWEKTYGPAVRAAFSTRKAPPKESL